MARSKTHQSRRVALDRSTASALWEHRVLVAPTSRSARPATFRPVVTVAGQDTRVLVEQVGAVDVERMGKRVGLLTASEMWSVDEALMTVLGLG